jgi:hypothetical protein
MGNGQHHTVKTAVHLLRVLRAIGAQLPLQRIQRVALDAVTRVSSSVLASSVPSASGAAQF